MALIQQMRVRGLRSAPPSYLGVYGGNSWEEEGLLDELVGDCYSYIFVRRLPGLIKQLILRPNIDGLVLRNIRNFLFDTQKKHDPLGYRVFEVLESAIQLGVEARRLYVLENGPKIRNATVLGFSQWSRPELSPPPDFSLQVKVWNDDLMPDLIRARGRARKELESQLKECIARLREEGVEGFRFKDLIDPMKRDVRLRCSALFSEGATATEDGEEELVTFVTPDLPGTGMEERQRFQALSSCVEESIDKQPVSRKKRDRLRKLLALERSRVQADEGKPLSNLGIARILGFPRDSIRGLKAKLRGVFEDCQEALSGKTPVRESWRASALQGSMSRAHQEGPTPMNPQSRPEWQRLQAEKTATGVAHALAEVRSGVNHPPRPGDTFLFRETSSYGVEWLVVEADLENQRRLLVVPVDDSPLVGSRDVEAADACDSPLSIRCASGVWLDAQAFDPELRTGSLQPEVVAEVRQRRNEIKDGTVEGTILEQEVDDDPAYKAWLDEVLGPALATLAKRFEGHSEIETAEARRVPTASMRLSVSGSLAIAASVFLVISVGILLSHLPEPPTGAGTSDPEEPPTGAGTSDPGVPLVEIPTLPSPLVSIVIMLVILLGLIVRKRLNKRPDSHSDHSASSARGS